MRTAILIEDGKEIFRGHPSDMPVRFVDTESGDVVQATMGDVASNGTPINDQGEDYEIYSEG